MVSIPLPPGGWGEPSSLLGGGGMDMEGGGEGVARRACAGQTFPLNETHVESPSLPRCSCAPHGSAGSVLLKTGRTSGSRWAACTSCSPVGMARCWWVPTATACCFSCPKTCSWRCWWRWPVRPMRLDHGVWQHLAARAFLSPAEADMRFSPHWNPPPPSAPAINTPREYVLNTPGFERRGLLNRWGGG